MSPSTARLHEAVRHAEAAKRQDEARAQPSAEPARARAKKAAPAAKSAGPRLGITVLNYVGERTKLGEFTGNSPGTYRKALWLFVRFAGGDLPVSRLNRSHVERWLISMNVAPSTMRGRLIMVRRPRIVEGATFIESSHRST